MTPLRVMLDYIYPWPNAAGFYVARDQGWYRELGLDVELTTHDHGRGDTLAHLQRAEVTFGVFPSNRLLVRRELGEPLIGVAAINHTGLETIQVIRERGITQLSELEGRTIAYGPTPRGRAMVAYLVKQAGGDPSKVITVDSGHNELTPQYLLSAGVDAMFGGYWCWDALTDDGSAEQLLTWPVSDLGAPRYHSYLLGTQTWTAERNPELVRGFLAATARGFRLAASDQEATVALLHRALPYLPEWKLARSLQLVSTSWFHEGNWGQQRQELVEGYADWLHEHGVLADPGVWRTATTDEFLPATDSAGPATTSEFLPE